MNINDHERNIEHLAWLDPKLTILSPGTEDGSECYNYCRPTDDPFQVKVIPRFDVEVPIEIISIIPDTVSLVDGNAKLVSKTSSGKAQSPAPKQPERNAIGTMMLDFQKDETAISGGDEAGTSANDSDIQPNVLSRMGTFLRMRRILTDNKTRKVQAGYADFLYYLDGSVYGWRKAVFKPSFPNANHQLHRIP